MGTSFSSSLHFLSEDRLWVPKNVFDFFHEAIQMNEYTGPAAQCRNCRKHFTTGTMTYTWQNHLTGRTKPSLTFVVGRQVAHKRNIFAEQIEAFKSFGLPPGLPTMLSDFEGVMAERKKVAFFNEPTDRKHVGRHPIWRNIPRRIDIYGSSRINMMYHSRKM